MDHQEIAGKYGITVDEVKKIEEIFNEYKKEDDTINLTELRSCLSVLCVDLTEQEVQQKATDVMGIMQMDDDHSTLNFEEFILVVCPLYLTKDQADEDLMNSFKEFDKDGNGKISRDELRKVLQEMGDDKLTDQEVDDIFNEVDSNEDGEIDMKEFGRWIRGY